MFDYADLKSLAEAAGVPVKDLLVLTAANDPFLRAFRGGSAAEWFANIWQTFDFRQGAHLRRIHYVLISQRREGPVARSAAVREHVEPLEALVMRQPRGPISGADPGRSAGRSAQPGADDPRGVRGRSRSRDHDGRGPFSVGIPIGHHSRSCFLSDFRRDQDFLVEVWIEKSTMNDILVPLSRRLGFNLVTGVGEMCETCGTLPLIVRHRRQVEADANFICVATSIREAARCRSRWHGRSNTASCQIGLAPTFSCTRSYLPQSNASSIGCHAPRSRISERRAGKFEERFGEGATELDALEALHPGELAEIVTTEVGRYLDPTLGDRVWEAKWEVNRRLEEIEDEVRASRRPRSTTVETAFAELRNMPRSSKSRR